MRKQKKQKSVVTDKSDILETTSDIALKENILDKAHQPNTDLVQAREETAVTPMVQLPSFYLHFLPEIALNLF